MNRLFERILSWARVRPDEAALVHGGAVSHTWAELVNAVGARAEGLRAAGVGPEVRVLLHRDPGPDWVVDALATWAAGGAIVPVDPALPARRKNDLASQAGARVCLGLPIGVHGCIPGNGPPAPLRPPPRDPARLAWLIFSSGSTGAPKGVLVACGNAVDVFAAQVEALALGPGDRCAWLLSPGVDASLSDVGVALFAGAALHTERPGLLRDPPGLVAVLADRRITYADLPPRYLDLLDPAALPDLRAVLCGGEPLPPAGARTWARARRLIGVYGPTEATICTSLWRVEPDDVDRPHLGRPVGGAVMRVVDGELWIGGPGLARGYLADPVRTEARFVEDGGQRWHRSGDRVEVAADGALLFAGRIDRQGKVDGRLVCPEEVEAALRSLPGVHDARADVVERGGVAMLEATVEGAPGLSSIGVGTALAELLPGWMLPRILEVGVLQRSPSGKALVQDPLSRTLSTVLGVQLGEDDSFAEAGLDSLRTLVAAARLMAWGVVVAPEQIRAADCLTRLRGALTPPTRPVRALEAEGRRLAWRGLERVASGRTVVLTGATGGLGVRLLPRLLGAGHPVVAVVRASDATHARHRLRDALARFGEDPDLAAHPGLRPHPGTLPGAELSTDDLGLVMHLAAAVDLSVDAQSLWPTNVEGTQEMAALAGRAGAPLLFASTLSVFVDTDAPRGRFAPEDALPDALVCGGYAQTKLVAEALVRASAVRSCCVRYGLLAPDRRTGSSGPRDWLRLGLRGLRTLGCVPFTATTRGLEVDLTPADDAADRTMGLVARLLAGTAPPVAHVSAAAPAGLPAVLDAMARAGVPLAVVETDVFLDRARGALASARSPEEAAALLGLVRSLGPDALGSNRALDLFQATGCRFASLPGIPAPTAADLDRVVRSAMSEPR